jgi:hypothetical protein
MVPRGTETVRRHYATTQVRGDASRGFMPSPGVVAIRVEIRTNGKAVCGGNNYWPARCFFYIGLTPPAVKSKNRS